MPQYQKYLCCFHSQKPELVVLPWPEATVLAPDLGLDHSVDVASAACGWPTP